jgi:hypothetical protein
LTLGRRWRMELTFQVATVSSRICAEPNEREPSSLCARPETAGAQACSNRKPPLTEKAPLAPALSRRPPPSTCVADCSFLPRCTGKARETRGQAPRTTFPYRARRAEWSGGEESSAIVQLPPCTARYGVPSLSLPEPQPLSNRSIMSWCLRNRSITTEEIAVPGGL